MSDPSELNAQLCPRIVEIAQALTGRAPTSRAGREVRFGTKGSLAVRPGTGEWFDHEAGVGGDALGLAAHLLACDMHSAAVWARSWLGQPPTLVVEPRPAPLHVLESNTTDLACRLWREAVPAKGGPVARYLAGRGGLLVPEDAPLRFHPNAWRNRRNGPFGPAMLALMTDPATAEPIGTHVTYLRPGGAGKADGDGKKIMLGSAGVIRLVPDEDVTLGLGLAEGIETSLAVMQHFEWSPVWAATSAGGIARFPVLRGLHALTIFADSDDKGAGMAAAEKCRDRWFASGQEVAIAEAPRGYDFADVGAAA